MSLPISLRASSQPPPSPPPAAMPNYPHRCELASLSACRKAADVSYSRTITDPLPFVLVLPISMAACLKSRFRVKEAPGVIYVRLFHSNRGDALCVEAEACFAQEIFFFPSLRYSFLGERTCTAVCVCSYCVSMRVCINLTQRSISFPWATLFSLY